MIRIFVYGFVVPYLKTTKSNVVPVLLFLMLLVAVFTLMCLWLYLCSPNVRL